MEHSLRKQVFLWLAIPGNLLFIVYEAMSSISHMLEMCGRRNSGRCCDSTVLARTNTGSRGEEDSCTPFFPIFLAITQVCPKSAFFKKNYLFIYLFIFWLHWVFTAARRLSLVAASGSYSSLLCTGCSWQWLLLLQSTGSRRVGFSSCGMLAQQLWLTGSRAQAQQLWRTGLVAPWHVGSSWTRARTRVPCIGRWILNHCATREVPECFFYNEIFTKLSGRRGRCQFRYLHGRQ